MALPNPLTVHAFQAGEPAFGWGRQAETVQVKLSAAVAFAHQQALSVHLADLSAHTQRRARERRLVLMDNSRLFETAAVNRQRR